MPVVESTRAKPDIRLERFRRTQRTFLSQFESRSPQRLHTLRWPDDGRPGAERSPGPFAQNLPPLKWTHEPKWRSPSFASTVILDSRQPITSASAPDLLGTAASRLRKSGTAGSLVSLGSGAADTDGVRNGKSSARAPQEEPDKPAAQGPDPSPLGPKALHLQSRLANDSQRLFAVDILFESIESGAIAPLRGSWVAALQKRGEILPKRAELPPDALFSIEHLRRLVIGMGADVGYLFVALSYRWLSDKHPDPEGFTLAIVASICRLYLKPKDDTTRAPRPQFPMDGPAPIHYSPLVEAFEVHDLGTADFVLLWDYASLYLADAKQPLERMLHRLGTQAASVWYSHAHVITWMVTEMPQPEPVVSPTGMTFFGAPTAVADDEPPPYGHTAWTVTESALGGAGLKPRHLLLDLSKRTELAMKTAYGARTVHGSWPAELRLDATCTAPRSPISLPNDFEFRIVGGRNQKPMWTARQNDKELLAKLYASTFDAMSRVARSLDYAEHGWGLAEAVVLSKTLPELTALTDLDLSRNQFDDPAAEALATGVRAMRNLKHFKFNKNRKTCGAGAHALADAVRQRSSTLRTFSGLPLAEYHTHRLEVAQATERRNSMRRPSSMPTAASSPIGKHLIDLNLSYTGLGTTEAFLVADIIAGALPESEFLRSVNVAGNIDILGEGAKRLAEAVLESESLEVFSKMPIKLLKEDRSIVGLDLSHETQTFFSRLQFVPHYDVQQLMQHRPVFAVLAEETLPRGAHTPRLGLVEALVLAPLLRASEILRSVSVAGNEMNDEAGLMLGMAAAEGAPSLVSLDLRCNELSEKTKKAVRTAIDARNAKLFARGLSAWNEDEPPLTSHL